jgi:hypothetical protein
MMKQISKKAGSIIARSGDWSLELPKLAKNGKSFSVILRPVYAGKIIKQSCMRQAFLLASTVKCTVVIQADWSLKVTCKLKN